MADSGEARLAQAGAGGSGRRVLIRFDRDRPQLVELRPGDVVVLEVDPASITVGVGDGGALVLRDADDAVVVLSGAAAGAGQGQTPVIELLTGELVAIDDFAAAALAAGAAPAAGGGAAPGGSGGSPGSGAGAFESFSAAPLVGLAASGPLETGAAPAAPDADLGARIRHFLDLSAAPAGGGGGGPPPPALGAPTLTPTPAAGAEDGAIPLTIGLTLPAGATGAAVTISGVPAGATLSAGTPAGAGTFVLTPAQLAGLSITPPPDSDADFTLGVTA